MYGLQVNAYLTNICNKGCPHCYYESGNIKMDLETAAKITSWISNLCRIEEVRVFRCHFLGGEPFENKEILFFMIEKLKEQLPEFTSGAEEGEFVIFTNGDLLNESTLRRVKDNRAMIMLNPTFDSLPLIERKMKMVKSICGGISLSVAVDELNMERLPDLAALAVKYNGHMRINRLYNGANILGYVERYKEQMHKVLDILLSAAVPMWPNFIIENSYITIPGFKNVVPCGRHLIVIDPDGTIRSCNADSATKVGSIGTIKKLSDIRFHQRWTAKNLPECQGCEWITWCQGGCPYVRKLTYGTYNKKTPFCEVNKEIFPRVMELKDKWLKYQEKKRIK